MSIDNPSKIISYPRFLFFMPKATHEPIKGYRMFIPSLAEDEVQGNCIITNIYTVYQITDIKRFFSQ